MTRLEDVLDRALDAPAPRPAVDPDVEPLVSLADEVRRTLRVPPSAEAARRHLAALGGAARQPRRLSRRSRAAVIGLAAAIALTAMSGAAVAASTTALPGQALYPVKRAVERLSLAVNRDAGERAGLHMRFADRRLVELDELLAARRSGRRVDVGAAMRAYQEAIGAAETEVVLAQALGRSDEALLAHVHAQLGKHVGRLEQLATRVPPQAQDAIRRAIDNAEKARGRVQQGRNKEAPGAPAGRPGRGPKKAGGGPQSVPSSRRP